MKQLAVFGQTSRAVVGARRAILMQLPGELHVCAFVGEQEELEIQTRLGYVVHFGGDQVEVIDEKTIDIIVVVVVSAGSIFGLGRGGSSA